MQCFVLRRGQLRSRAEAHGAYHLDPTARLKVLVSNMEVEVVYLMTEQALLCSARAVGLMLVFPEELGDQVLLEFQLLEGVGEARQGAGFRCQLARAEQRRPFGILFNITAPQDKLHVG